MDTLNIDNFFFFSSFTMKNSEEIGEQLKEKLGQSFFSR